MISIISKDDQDVNGKTKSWRRNFRCLPNSIVKMTILLPSLHLEMKSKWIRKQSCRFGACLPVSSHSIDYNEAATRQQLNKEIEPIIAPINFNASTTRPIQSDNLATTLVMPTIQQIQPRLVNIPPLRLTNRIRIQSHRRRKLRLLLVPMSISMILPVIEGGAMDPLFIAWL